MKGDPYKKKDACRFVIISALLGETIFLFVIIRTVVRKNSRDSSVCIKELSLKLCDREKEIDSLNSAQNFLYLSKLL